MLDFNQAIVLGNVTKDPELRNTPNGQPVISFSVATNRQWKGNDGQIQKATEFHNIVAWGKLAEICNQILYKGRKIMVVGRLQTRSWEGQDGNKRYTTEIVASDVVATGSPRSQGEQELQTAQRSEPTINTNKPITEPKKSDDEINLDDIPF